MRPTSAYTGPTAPKVVVPRRGASAMMQGPPIVPDSYYSSPADKENDYYSAEQYQQSRHSPPLKSAFATGNSNGQKKRVTLGLAIAGVSPQQATVSAFEPNSGSSKLKRKSKRKSYSSRWQSLRARDCSVAC